MPYDLPCLVDFLGWRVKTAIPLVIPVIMFYCVGFVAGYKGGRSRVGSDVYFAIGILPLSAIFATWYVLLKVYGPISLPLPPEPNSMSELENCESHYSG